MAEQNKRYAVVTGANKGIGFGICKQLASHGITVILTARDEKRGLEAVQKLKDSGLSDYVLFHQLDVADPASIAVLADFIKSQIGKLDILVNNAGITGVKFDVDVINAAKSNNKETGETKWSEINWSQIMTQTYELAEECITINYYGGKRMAEALIPLLQLSDSPRIVNLSSAMGKLENVPYEWVKEELGDADKLSEEKIDGILSQYLRDFKQGPTRDIVTYKIVKACLNAYTRIQAKKYPNFRINCVCPGNVKTDMNFNTGPITVDEGAEGPVALALLPNDGPSGFFFTHKEISTF